MRGGASAKRSVSYAYPPEPMLFPTPCLRLVPCLRDSFNAVLIIATGHTPRSVSDFGIAGLTARVLTEVLAVSMLDSISGLSATLLCPVYSGADALYRVVMGGHRAHPTTITSPTLWGHMVRFNQPRVSQGKVLLFRGNETHRHGVKPTVSATVNRSPCRTVPHVLACIQTERVRTMIALVSKSVPL